MINASAATRWVPFYHWHGRDSRLDSPRLGSPWEQSQVKESLRRSLLSADIGSHIIYIRCDKFMRCVSMLGLLRLRFRI